GQQALEPGERRRPQVAQDAEGGVVPDQSLEVAHHAAAEAERPHGDDRDHQVQHRGHLAGPHDQPGGRGGEPDGRGRGPHAEDDGEEQAEAVAPGEAADPAEGRHRATSEGAVGTSSMTWSATASAAGRWLTITTAACAAAARTARSTSASVAGSSPAVGSSRRSSAGRRSSARASATRRRSPADSPAPDSPTTCSRQAGSRPAAARASATRSSEASGSLSRTLSATVPGKR